MVKLYPKAQTKFPAWLRTEKVEPTWKELRLPAFLANVSLVIGHRYPDNHGGSKKISLSA